MTDLIVENIHKENFVKANELLENKIVKILKDKLKEAKKFILVKNFIKKTEFDKLPSNVKKIDKLSAKEKKGEVDHKKSPKNKFMGFTLESVIDDILNEANNHNIQKAGRVNIIRGRIRNGKVQRRKRVSGVSGYTLQGNRVVRISPQERRNRRMGARRGKIKRRSKMATIRRKTKVSLRKRRSMGFDR